MSLAEAKTHLRVDASEQDAEIAAIVQRARQALETDTGRALLTQTYDFSLDGFPCKDRIDLPRAPLQSVTSATYRIWDGGSETFDLARVAIETAAEPGFIELRGGYEWPTEELDAGLAVTIRFVAGWSAAASVPKDLIAALLLRVEQFYRLRGAVTMGNTAAVESKPLAMGYDRLIAPYRLFEFGR